MAGMHGQVYEISLESMVIKNITPIRRIKLVNRLFRSNSWQKDFMYPRGMVIRAISR